MRLTSIIFLIGFICTIKSTAQKGKEEDLYSKAYQYLNDSIFKPKHVDVKQFAKNCKECCVKGRERLKFENQLQVANKFDGFRRDLIQDDAFEKILLNDLENGIHINDTDNLEYFTTAFFHTPQEIKDDIAESGLKLEKLVAVESAGWLIDKLSEKVKDESYRTKIQKIINIVESKDELIAMSPHILGIARKI